MTAGAHNISLISNEINFANKVSGTGDLTIKPFNEKQNIAIGGSTDTGSDTLNLLSSETQRVAKWLQIHHHWQCVPIRVR
ncbi:MAG: hypothetical protein U7123_06685 [Potamolinea sp.]